MNYAALTDTIMNVVKSAVPENSDTTKYSEIPEVDKQRDLIVSHLKSTYDGDTNHQLSAKEFVDTAKTYKNMMMSEEGEREKLTRKMKELESQISANKDELESSLKVKRVLQILLVTAVITLGIYIVGGSFQFVHTLAFFVLLAGLMAVLYSRGEKTEWIMPDMKLGDMKVPDMKLGDMKVPDMKVGDMKVPDIRGEKTEWTMPWTKQ